ncbi:MAG TPA: ADOP family duplicated permease [Opitutaceae bacterium]|nr:ADOP family duplicated permease [Opitutaceae bacterium]
MSSFRLALRTLARSPGFTAAAVATLALCIAANLAIFACVDAILVRPLPFPQPERLVTLNNGYPAAGAPRIGSSMSNYFERREGLAAFAAVAVFREGSLVLGGTESPNRVRMMSVSPEFFSSLGVTLARGRAFNEAEMAYGADGVAVITDSFWRSQFNADPAVIGRTFLNDGNTVTVVGLLPSEFRFLSSRAQFFRPAAHAPEERTPQARHNNGWQMLGRLAPAATLAQAQAQLDALNARLAASDPFAAVVKDAGFHTTVADLHADYVRTIRPLLLLLQCAVLLLLFIGCFNLANLVLVRAAGRQHDIAVRLALGAGWRHLLRQTLAEPLLLALAGGLAGLALGAYGIGLLHTLGADQIPLGGEIGLGPRAALAALAASLAVGLGLAAPLVWFNRRLNLAAGLHEVGRTASTGRNARRLNQIFIVAQIALAFALLAGAGLLATSLQRVLSTDPGFAPDNVLAGSISPPWINYRDTAARLAYSERLLAAVRALPGVEQAAIGTGVPFTGGASDNAISAEGFDYSRGGAVRAHYVSTASADYWSLLRIPLLRGRYLEEADDHRPAQNCVVDRAFAERYWPGQDPIGRRLSFGAPFDPARAITIVGVVGEVKQNEVAEPAGHGAVYCPFPVTDGFNFSLLVRTALPDGAIIPALRKAVLQVDPALPIDNLRPLQQGIDDTLLVRRSPAVLAGVFAAVALLLAGIGTYGVLSYSVSRRQREIGIRTALGARPEGIRRMFLGSGLRLLGIGLLLGGVGALAIGRAMQSILFSMPALHIPSIGFAAVAMGLIVLLSSWLPARRASRVDPLVALRSE